jgi:glucose/arabinose dehydrogenase
MFLDAAGNVAYSTKVLEHCIRLRSAVQDPDGNLYITTDAGNSGGEIWKVVPGS